MHVSYCIGIYNEEKTLLKNINKYKIGLDNILGKENYEIILVDNGSKDNTAKILKKIKDPRIKSYFIKKKAHGLALKIALYKAIYAHVVITAIDIPFGFDDLKSALKLWKIYDIIFGSKAHKDSIICNPLKRKIASFVFRIILRILFNNPIKDPQGSIFLKRNKIKPILKYCTAENAFFTTQIALYGNLFNLKMIEIPVKLHKTGSRISKYNIIVDGLGILINALKEYIKYKKIS